MTEGSIPGGPLLPLAALAVLVIGRWAWARVRPPSHDSRHPCSHHDEQHHH